MPSEVQIDPFVCRRCARASPTCCRCRPEELEMAAPVSEGERAALAQVFPQEIEHLLVRAENTTAFRERMFRLFPDAKDGVEAAFPPDRSHFRLAVGDDGACLLLTGQGCRAPRQARPLYCQIYPFWLAGQERHFFVDPDCLAQEEAESLDDLARILKADWAEVENLHARLRRAWGIGGD